MTQNKYIVKKLDSGEVLKPEEYFVLRKQDILAASALWTYVNAIRTALDTIVYFGGKFPLQKENEHMKIVGYLEELANETAQKASLWETEGVKLPD